jgi:biotin carboxyl carrier protein
LEVGDRIEKGDVVAVVNSQLAQDDLELRVAELESVEAKRRASEKTRDEAKKRFDAMVEIMRKVPNAVSPDDLRAAQLTWQKYIEEELAEAANVRRAGHAVLRALAVLRMHEVRADISGKVTTIFKNRGEAVKELETVVQIRN